MSASYNNNSSSKKNTTKNGCSTMKNIRNFFAYRILELLLYSIPCWECICVCVCVHFYVCLPLMCAQSERLVQFIHYISMENIRRRLTTYTRNLRKKILSICPDCCMKCSVFYSLAKKRIPKKNFFVTQHTVQYSRINSM